MNSVFIQPFPKKVVPSQLPVNNCLIPKEFKDKPIQLYQINQQPYINQNQVRRPVNVKTGLHPSPDFTPIQTSSGVVYSKEYGGRTMSAPRGQRILLNEPAPVSVMTNQPTLNSVYLDKSLDGYGQNYQTYSDIHAGQIQYYGNTKTDVLYKPLFTIRANVKQEVFRDPMDALKPQYKRSRLAKHLRDIPYQFDRDQMEFREDLMNLQMRQQNQRDWNRFYDPKLF